MVIFSKYIDVMPTYKKGNDRILYVHPHLPIYWISLVCFSSFPGDQCRLNGKDLVNHIITMLRIQDKAFVADYQNILLKYVLSSRTYCCELTSQMWQGQ